MMNIYDIAISYLPFYMQDGKNIQHAYKAIAKIFEDILVFYSEIKLFMDIDQATGIGLDRIGNIIGEERLGRDDETYRIALKIRILINQSYGDIETINEVARVMLNDSFKHLQETWRLEEYDHSPAGIVLKLQGDKLKVPYEIIRSAVAGGVKIYYGLDSDPYELILKTSYWDFDVPYKICNMFQTAEVPGGLMKAPIILEPKVYAFNVLYPICNTFVTSQISVENEKTNVILANEYRNNEVLFKRVGNVRVGEGDI